MSLADAYLTHAPAPASTVQKQARASMKAAVMAMRAVLEADDGLGFKQYYDLSTQLSNLPEEPSDEAVFCFSNLSDAPGLSSPEDRAELYPAVVGLVLNYQDWKEKEAQVGECDRRLGAVASKKRAVRSLQKSCRSQLEGQVPDVRGFVKYCVSLCEHEKSLKSLYAAAKQMDDMLVRVRALESLPRLKLDQRTDGTLPIAVLLHAREPDIKAALEGLRESGVVNAKTLSRLQEAVSLYDSLNPVLGQLDAMLPSYLQPAQTGVRAEEYLRSRCESARLSQEWRGLQSRHKELAASRYASLKQVTASSQAIGAFKEKMSRQAVLDYERVGEDVFLASAFDVEYRTLGFIKMEFEGVPGRGRTDVGFSFNFVQTVPICMKHPEGTIVDGMDAPGSYLEDNVLFLNGASKDVGFKVNLRMPVVFRDYR